MYFRVVQKNRFELFLTHTHSEFVSPRIIIICFHLSSILIIAEQYITSKWHLTNFGLRVGEREKVKFMKLRLIHICKLNSQNTFISVHVQMHI